MGKNFTQGHALIVGVGGAQDLPYTVDDAKGIASILGDPGRCAYPKDQVQLLTGAKARRGPVLKGLDMLAGVGADSSVIVYFSGHGEQVRRGKKTAYYLMPHGYDLDRLEETAISGTEFAAKLSNIKSERLLVLLDCCHAGGFSGALALPQDAKSPQKAVFKSAPLPPEAKKIFADKTGRVLIASSKGSELSYAGKPYSAFTTALIAALCGEGAAQEDGYVRVVDLALYTREAVIKLTLDEQHPTMDIEKADNFAVAYYAGGGKKRKGLPASIEKPQIQTKPGLKDYSTFDTQTWNSIQANVINIQNETTRMRDRVTNIRRNTEIVHGDKTEFKTGDIGFLQYGWKVNKVYQGEQPPNKRKRRR
jgi:hypothetical protein